MIRRPAVHYRKLYTFYVEKFDATHDDWSYLGSVLLPDNAYRDELAHALRVFGLRLPRTVDRTSWSYATLPGPLETGPLPWPRVRITDNVGTPLVRLSARSRNIRELGHKKI